MIHYTRGVYPNGEFKDNGVAESDLASHIWYNLTFRPGRAFFFNGFCLNRGISVSDELIKKHAL